jgi:ectoine hydroxylase-related dioxygenase (phytanoyl-CoA dioxygenase family)
LPVLRKLWHERGECATTLSRRRRYHLVVLDPAAIEAFETDGVVAVRGLLDRAWIDSLAEAMPSLLPRAYDPVVKMGGEPGRVVQTEGMWRDCEPFRRFLFESPVGAVAAAALRASSVRLYEDLLLYRAPGAGGEAGWHRDSPYWPVAGRELANVWLSLEPVTATTGAIRVVARSHLDSDDVARVGVTPEIDPERVVIVETEPGDVVVFHPRALHTGYGSSPDQPRRTFTIRFMGDDVRWRPRRDYFHDWMRDCGLEKGAVVDHEGFPVVWSAELAGARDR